MKGTEAMSVEHKYKMLLHQHSELQAAAQKVCDETDRILDDVFPLKYRAPYGALAELRALLYKQYGLRSPSPPPSETEIGKEQKR